MKEETKQGIALARYAAIAPLVAGLAENYKSNREYYADRAEKGIQYPDGSLRHPSPDTIEKWYLMYRKKGFDALVPAARSDAGRSRRLDDDARERIRYLKTHYPRMSAAAIHRNLNDDGTFPPGAVSESTVCRFIRQMEAEERGTGQRDMRRSRARVAAWSRRTRRACQGSLGAVALGWARFSACRAASAASAASRARRRAGSSAVPGGSWARIPWKIARMSGSWAPFCAMGSA